MPTCPHCKEEVKEGATVCPHCQKNIAPMTNGDWVIVAVVLTVVALVFFFIVLPLVT